MTQQPTRHQAKAALLCEMYKSQNGKCYYCNEKMSIKPRHRVPGRLAKFAATFDHIIPLGKGGAMSRSKNTVIACHACNQERGERDAREFLFEKQGII